MEKATFDAYVEFAGLMLVLVREEWGETLADGWVYGYVHDEERREALLLELIVCSEEVKEAWDSLSLIAQGLLLERKPLPHELADWLVQALEGTRRQPKSRGKDPYANFFRNSAIVLAVSFLSRERIKATRNGGGPPECCYEGGSACDAVGLAVAEIYEEPRSYKNIEYIWTESASPDSHLYRFGPSRCPIVRHPTCVLSTRAKSRGRHAPDILAASRNNMEVMPMSTDRDVLLTRREVERLCRLGRSTLYKKMREGTFPVPLKVSERAVRWRESEIRAYVDSRPRSMGIRQPDQKKRPAV